MAIQRYKAEQIVTMLRQIEVSIANGKTTPQACKEASSREPKSRHHCGFLGSRSVFLREVDQHSCGIRSGIGAQRRW